MNRKFRVPHSPHLVDNQLISKSLKNEVWRNCQTSFLNCQRFNGANSNFDMKKEFPYKAARLVVPDGSTGKWFVEWYVWDETNEKLTRKRYFKKFASLKTYGEKLQYGRQIVKEVNEILPYSVINPAPKHTPKLAYDDKMTLRGAIDMVNDQLYLNAAKKTRQTFKSIAEQFLEWIDAAPFIIPTAADLTKNHVQKYVDSLRNSPKTISNKVTVLRAIFNHLLAREIVQINPFIDLILPKQKQTAKNRAYSLDQIKQIKKYMLDKNPYLWNVCQVIYYTYIRPGELKQLKCGHFLIEERKIYIPGEIAKTNKSFYVTIPEPLIPILEALQINNQNAELFAFSVDGCPGEKPVSDNYFNKQYKRIKTALNLPDDCTLYSWKHTGVTMAYKNGVDIKSIQMQCRHANINQTDVYLKSLGFLENESFRVGIPEI
jgi:integrase